MRGFPCVCRADAPKQLRRIVKRLAVHQDVWHPWMVRGRLSLHQCRLCSLSTCCATIEGGKVKTCLRRTRPQTLFARLIVRLCTLDERPIDRPLGVVFNGASFNDVDVLLFVTMLRNDCPEAICWRRCGLDAGIEPTMPLIRIVRSCPTMLGGIVRIAPWMEGKVDNVSNTRSVQHGWHSASGSRLTLGSTRLTVEINRNQRRCKKQRWRHQV
mmetsp:Transcript_58518/g.125753  ORF Transcript_58518/g.125753 Transcript_58518/m.125753 type:complete len:213 (-) Transcript_58518:70-708(-)